MTPVTHSSARWMRGRMPRPHGARWGFYTIHGDPWTTWTFIAGRWEYYVARRDPAARR